MALPVRVFLIRYCQVLRSFVIDGWRGKAHPAGPVVVGLVLAAGTLPRGHFIRWNSVNLPYPLDLMFICLLAAIGLWSARASWKCAHNGWPIWPSTWRVLSVVGAISGILWASLVMLMVLVEMVYYWSRLTGS